MTDAENGEELLGFLCFVGDGMYRGTGNTIEFCIDIEFDMGFGMGLDICIEFGRGGDKEEAGDAHWAGGQRWKVGEKVL